VVNPQWGRQWLLHYVINDWMFLPLVIYCDKKIALGVAYAMWEGVGIILISLCSLWLFDETLSAGQLFGLVLLILGITLIKIGTRATAPKEQGVMQ